MKKCYLLLLLSVFWMTASAQNQEQRATFVSKATYMIEVPALSEMDNIIASDGFEHVAPPKRRGRNTFVPGKGFPKGADPLVQRQIAVQPSAGRTPVASFPAHEGTVLNDPTGAIGPNHYVYAYNSGFGILDRSGNVLAPGETLATLFPGESDAEDGDPVVIYDRYADRFIIMEFFGSHPQETEKGFLIAVGKGPDPLNDGWYSYRFDTDTFPDYEKMSIWGDGYYITANKDNGSQGTSEVVFALERDEMLTGNLNARIIGFPLPGTASINFYSPGGFNATGPNLPPVGTPCPIVFMQDDGWQGVSQDHLKIWNISTDWNTPSNSTISQPQELTTAAFDSVLDGGSFNNLQEPGSGPHIDALQSAMMYMTNYRRFGTHNSAVMNFVVDVSGNDTKAGIRWFELRQSADGQPWTVYQEGTYSQPNHSAFCGSIAMDAQGNIGMGYTIVSSTVYTSLRYTGRLASDPLGVMTVAEQTIVDGNQPTAYRNDGRYGDYAQLTIDPLDDMTFWHIGEYMQGTTNIRKSHVAAFKITPPEPDNEAPTAPTNLTASNTTTTTTTLSWNAATDNVAVTAYDVYQDGSVIGTTAATSYSVSGLTANTGYSFYVIAKDDADNQSTASNTVNVTTLETSSGCAGGVTSYPYSQGFENTIGSWTQDTDDDGDWVVNSGTTPSRRTGPSSATEGSYYIFVEASTGSGNTGYPNKRAVITSPCYDLTAATSATFSFQYHMYGANSGMGSIALEASNDEGNTWSTLWSLSNSNQGNSWSTQNVDLAAYVGGSVQLRFNRLTGSTWRADIAIDDVSLTANTGGGTGPSDCEASNLTLTITFDDYPEETSWTLRTAGGTTVASNSYSTANPDGSTVVENINNLTSGDYVFTINDDYGDGICCGYGNGSYTLESSEGVIVSGGNFGASEVTNFCVDDSLAKLKDYVLTRDESDIFKLYPNPVNSRLYITTNETIDEVRVFSTLGMLVSKASKVNGNEGMDVSQLPKGTYFARMTSGETVITRKFVKE